MHLTDMYNNTLSRSPKNFAVLYDGEFYSYEYIDNKAEKLAISLSNLGIGKQDRIMVMLKNCIENIIIFWATQKINAVYVPINIDMSSEYIKYCLDDVEAKVLFLKDANNNIIKDLETINELIIISTLGEADFSFAEMIKNGNGNLNEISKDDENLAIILYTSGTSGRPKGVPRTHKNEYASTIAHIIQNTYKRGDSTIGAVQLYHTMGMRAFLSMAFLSGCYFVHTEYDAEDILKEIQDYKITTLFLTPTQIHDLLAISNRYYDVSSIRVISYAGAPMSTNLIERCENYFQPREFINHYGSTEIYTISTSDKIRDNPLSAGNSGLHSEIKIIPINGEYHIDSKSKKEVGEITVSLNSDEAFKGYWNRPDETAKVIKNGWYHTGDIGRTLKSGELVVVGRLDEMILSNGENIHPHQIEQILNDHPSVVESVVVGETDERLGEMISAYIVSKDDTINFLDLDSYCKTSNLSTHLRPRKYTFLDELPLNKKGKVDRKLLQSAIFNET
ncbi:AMP-binding protein [Salinicoccus sp. HZC-1]|uniref:class I adenylate-forming enzyme family protein n=1 Tax=Salinicoccus sp. HZC-1 TaxID=3385497 RepID=UPI00398B0E0C